MKHCLALTETLYFLWKIYMRVSLIGSRPVPLQLHQKQNQPIAITFEKKGMQKLNGMWDGDILLCCCVTSLSLNIVHYNYSFWSPYPIYLRHLPISFLLNAFTLLQNYIKFMRIIQAKLAYYISILVISPRAKKGKAEVLMAWTFFRTFTCWTCLKHFVNLANTC